MIIDWSNNVLYSGSDVLSLGICSYCKQDAVYDKENECVNCGAHKDDKPKDKDND